MHDGMYIVDGDGHVVDLIDGCYRNTCPRSTAAPGFLPGRPWDRNQAAGWPIGRAPPTVAENLADNDAEGIDLAILYPTLGLNIGEVRERIPDRALPRLQRLGRRLLQGRSRPTEARGDVPVRDPTEACREMNRAGSRPRPRRRDVPDLIRGRTVAEKFFWPIYGEAEKLGVPIGMHASGSETSDVGRFETSSACTLVARAGTDDLADQHRLGGIPGCSSTAHRLPGVGLRLGALLDGAPAGRVGVTASRRPAVQGGAAALPDLRPRLLLLRARRRRPFLTWRSGWARISCSTRPTTPTSTASGRIRAAAERDDLSASLKRKLLGENALRFYGIQAAVPTA